MTAARNKKKITPFLWLFLQLLDLEFKIKVFFFSHFFKNPGTTQVIITFTESEPDTRNYQEPVNLPLNPISALVNMIY